MTPSPDLTAARRRAIIDRADAAGSPARLQLLNAGALALVEIVLARPCGLVDTTGVALFASEYAQILVSGDVASARLLDGAGQWVADFSVGLATDDPLPELPLPAMHLYAGAFVRLVASHIDCD